MSADRAALGPPRLVERPGPCGRPGWEVVDLPVGGRLLEARLVLAARTWLHQAWAKPPPALLAASAAGPHSGSGDGGGGGGGRATVCVTEWPAAVYRPSPSSRDGGGSAVSGRGQAAVAERFWFELPVGGPANNSGGGIGLLAPSFVGSAVRLSYTLQLDLRLAVPAGGSTGPAVPGEAGQRGRRLAEAAVGRAGRREVVEAAFEMAAPVQLRLGGSDPDTIQQAGRPPPGPLPARWAHVTPGFVPSAGVGGLGDGGSGEVMLLRVCGGDLGGGAFSHGRQQWGDGGARDPGPGRGGGGGRYSSTGLAPAADDEFSISLAGCGSAAAACFLQSPPPAHARMGLRLLRQQRRTGGRHSSRGERRAAEDRESRHRAKRRKRRGRHEEDRETEEEGGRHKDRGEVERQGNISSVKQRPGCHPPQYT